MNTVAVSRTRARLVRKYLLSALLFFFYVTGAVNTPASENGTAATITLYAHGDSVTGSSNGSLGHTFITIENKLETNLDFSGYTIRPHCVISVSIWPDSMGAGGVYINREMAGPDSNVGCDCACISTDISKETFDAIASMTPGESYYHDENKKDPNLLKIHDNFWHNCTSYSLKVWNMAAKTELSVSDGVFGIDAPKWVRKNICELEGHREEAFSHDQRLTGSDVFYLSQSGELSPAFPAAPEFVSQDAGRYSAALTWTPPLAECNIPLHGTVKYEIRYYALRHPNFIYNKHTQDTTCTIECPENSIYAFNVRCIYTDSSGVNRFPGFWSDQIFITPLTDPNKKDTGSLPPVLTLPSGENGRKMPDEQHTQTAPPTAISGQILSEDQLRALAEEKGSIGLWGYADYDADGNKEAFFIITDGQNEILSVYFAYAYGNLTLMADDITGACYAADMSDSEYLLPVPGGNIFYADYGAYGSGWQTLLFGVRNGSPYELAMSRDIQGIYRDGDRFYTTGDDFSAGFHEYPEIDLVYDSASGEFQS